MPRGSDRVLFLGEDAGHGHNRVVLVGFVLRSHGTPGPRPLLNARCDSLGKPPGIDVASICDDGGVESLRQTVQCFSEPFNFQPIQALVLQQDQCVRVEWRRWFRTISLRLALLVKPRFELAAFGRREVLNPSHLLVRTCSSFSGTAQMPMTSGPNTGLRPASSRPTNMRSSQNSRSSTGGDGASLGDGGSWVRSDTATED